jgi:hypothetical protein
MSKVSLPPGWTNEIHRSVLNESLPKDNNVRNKVPAAEGKHTRAAAAGLVILLNSFCIDWTADCHEVMTL